MQHEGNNSSIDPAAMSLSRDPEEFFSHMPPYIGSQFVQVVKCCGPAGLQQACETGQSNATGTCSLSRGLWSSKVLRVFKWDAV